MSNWNVKITNMQGTADAEGKAWHESIEAEAVHFGIDLPVLHGGEDRTEGSAVHSDLAIVHGFDKASPKLRLSACNGTNLGQVKLFRIRTFDNGQGGKVAKPRETITLENARVTSVLMNTPVKPDGTGPSGEVRETFTLRHDGAANWTYHKYVNGVEQGSISGDA